MEPLPTPPSPHVRARMKAQPRSDTKPEVRVRKALFKAGMRYRCGYPVPGRPRRSIDIAFVGPRLAVFIDGCFWHKCPDHFVPPKANAAWWLKKIETNVRRDKETDQLLDAQGWQVLRLWEHTQTAEALAQISSLLKREPDGEL